MALGTRFMNVSFVVDEVEGMLSGDGVIGGIPKKKHTNKVK